MAEQQTWQWPSRIALLADRSERNFYFTCKRCLDLILAGVLFVFLFPLFLLISVLIRLDSPGPVLFTQERVGAKRFFFSSRRRHTIFDCDWSSDVCSSD